MQDPLKQGLKLPPIFHNPFFLLRIRMQDPLKQGLKQELLYELVNIQIDSNARSIKTRIETNLLSTKLS